MIESRRLAPLLAAAGLLLLLHRLLDFSVALAQVDLAIPAGRARFLGLAVSRTPGPLMADLLLIGAAVTARYSGPLRALAWTHLAGGGLCLVAVPWLLTESGRVASMVSSAESTSFRLLVVRGLLVLLLLGVGALLAGRTLLALSREPVPRPD